MLGTMPAPLGSFLRATLPLLVMAVLRVNVAVAADAQQTALAEQLFRDGRALRETGRLEEALAKFETSQRLDPGVGTLLNLADCLERLGKTASAWARFSEAYQWATRDGDGARASAAEDRMRALEARLSKLVVRVVEPSTSVFLDTVPLSAALFDVTAPIDPGVHQLTASAPGKEAWEQSFEVPAEGGLIELLVPALAESKPAVTPPVEASPRATPEPQPPRLTHAEVSPSAPPRPIPTLSYGMGGLGLLGVGVGLGYGLAAMLAWDDAGDQGCEDGVCPTASAQRRAETAQSRADVSTVGFVAGGALLGAALLVVWLSEPSAEAEPALAVQLGATPSSRFVSVSGGF